MDHLFHNASGDHVKISDPAVDCAPGAECTVAGYTVEIIRRLAPQLVVGPAPKAVQPAPPPVASVEVIHDVKPAAKAKVK